MRFGFAAKVLGEPGLKSNDARRWQSNPHLGVSLNYLRDIIRYLEKKEVHMYRMSSDLAPYITHPEMPQFHGQIDECLAELADVGSMAREADIRLSFHPSQYVVLNSPEERVAGLALADYHAEARILDEMGQGPEAVVITHVGGVYGDKPAGMERFVENYGKLSDTARRRLVLENDETSYSVEDCLYIHSRTGIRIVFDYLHHMNLNPSGWSLSYALGASLATWPRDVTPKIHFSSPRTELREVKRKSPVTGKSEVELLPPLSDQHSDYLNPYEFAFFMEHAEGLRNFDVMLEAKGKDLALLRLREQLAKMGLPGDLDSES
jgi:UV DNA damage endonuclease